MNKFISAYCNASIDELGSILSRLEETISKTPTVKRRASDDQLDILRCLQCTLKHLSKPTSHVEPLVKAGQACTAWLDASPIPQPLQSNSLRYHFIRQLVSLRLFKAVYTECIMLCSAVGLQHGYSENNSLPAPTPDIGKDDITLVVGTLLSLLLSTTEDTDLDMRPMLSLMNTTNPWLTALSKPEADQHSESFLKYLYKAASLALKAQQYTLALDITTTLGLLINNANRVPQLVIKIAHYCPANIALQMLIKTCSLHGETLSDTMALELVAAICGAVQRAFHGTDDIIDDMFTRLAIFTREIGNIILKDIALVLPTLSSFTSDRPCIQFHQTTYHNKAAALHCLTLVRKIISGKAGIEQDVVMQKILQVHPTVIRSIASLLELTCSLDSSQHAGCISIALSTKIRARLIINTKDSSDYYCCNMEAVEALFGWAYPPPVDTCLLTQDDPSTKSQELSWLSASLFNAAVDLVSCKFYTPAVSALQAAVTSALAALIAATRKEIIEDAVAHLEDDVVKRITALADVQSKAGEIDEALSTLETAIRLLAEYNARNLILVHSLIAQHATFSSQLEIPRFLVTTCRLAGLNDAALEIVGLKEVEMWSKSTRPAEAEMCARALVNATSTGEKVERALKVVHYVHGEDGRIALLEHAKKYAVTRATRAQVEVALALEQADGLAAHALLNLKKERETKRQARQNAGHIDAVQQPQQQHFDLSQVNTDAWQEVQLQLLSIQGDINYCDQNAQLEVAVVLATQRGLYILDNGDAAKVLKATCTSLTGNYYCPNSGILEDHPLVLLRNAAEFLAKGEVIAALDLAMNVHRDVSQALAVARARHKWWQTACAYFQCLLLLGEIFEVIGSPDEALLALKEAQRLSACIGAALFNALSCCRIASILQKQEMHEQAQHAGQMAKMHLDLISTESPFKLLVQGEIRIFEAASALAQGNLDQAQESVSHFLDVSQTDDSSLLDRAHVLLLQCNNDRDSAEYSYRTSRCFAEARLIQGLRDIAEYPLSGNDAVWGMRGDDSDSAGSPELMHLWGVLAMSREMPVLHRQAARALAPMCGRGGHCHLGALLLHASLGCSLRVQHTYVLKARSSHSIPEAAVEDAVATLIGATFDWSMVELLANEESHDDYSVLSQLDEISAEILQMLVKSLPHGSIACSMSVNGVDSNRVLLSRLLPDATPIVLDMAVSSYSPGLSQHPIRALQMADGDKEEENVPVSPPELPTSSVLSVLSEFTRILDDSGRSMRSMAVNSKDGQRAWWRTRMDLDDALGALLLHLDTQWLGPWRCLLYGVPAQQKCDISAALDLLFGNKKKVLLTDTEQAIIKQLLLALWSGGLSTIELRTASRTLCTWAGVNPSKASQLIDILTTAKLGDSLADTMGALSLKDACLLDDGGAMNTLAQQNCARGKGKGGGGGGGGGEVAQETPLPVKSRGHRSRLAMMTGPAKTTSRKAPSTRDIFMPETEPIFNRTADYPTTKDNAAAAAAAKYAPVILVLDGDLQCLPWEAAVKGGQRFHRIPSLACAAAAACLSPNSTLDLNCTYYSLNPSGDLFATQEAFETWFSSLDGWQGRAGEVPPSSELTSALQTKSFFVYLGHGGGEQYLAPARLRSLDKCAGALLMGCSSGYLAPKGSNYDPAGIILAYLLGGSPAAVGNLWDVTDKDIDRFSQAALTAWLTGKERDVAGAVNNSREACKLKFLVGAAPVCYGLPALIKTTNNT